MDLREYYGIEEDVEVSVRYIGKMDTYMEGIGYDIEDFWNLFYGENCSLIYFKDELNPTRVNRMFYGVNSKLIDIENINLENVQSMDEMMMSSPNLIYGKVPYFDYKNKMSMRDMYASCGALLVLDLRETNFENIRDMYQAFYQSKEIYNIKWPDGYDVIPTKNVTNMQALLDGSKLSYLPALDASGTDTWSNYGLFFSSDLNYLDRFGGLIGLKSKINSNYGCFNKCPKLNRQSYINLFNGLYDFTGNEETPNSNQGILKLHSNYLKICTEDDINIAINKGWTLTT